MENRWLDFATIARIMPTMHQGGTHLSDYVKVPVHTDEALDPLSDQLLRTGLDLEDLSAVTTIDEGRLRELCHSRAKATREECLLVELALRLPPGVLREQYYPEG